MSNNTLTLFCFPYAGGNAFSYRGLEAQLAPAIKVHGVELPGRGRRTNQPLLRDIDALADDCFHLIRTHAKSGPFAFFGHSMGAALAYLTSLRLRRAGLPLPECLFISGKSSPTTTENKSRHLLAPAAFIEMLNELGGCPPEILADAELMAYFEPILRADFQAIETWQHRPEPPLPVPFVVLFGRDDDISADEMAKWADETSHPIQLHAFHGDHFFIQQHWVQIGDLIQQQLLPVAIAATSSE